MGRARMGEKNTIRDRPIILCIIQQAFFMRCAWVEYVYSYASKKGKWEGGVFLSKEKKEFGFFLPTFNILSIVHYVL